MPEAVARRLAISGTSDRLIGGPNRAESIAVGWKSEGHAMAKDPRDAIRRLTEAVQRQSKANAALLETIVRQKHQITNRDLTIKRLKARQRASAKHVQAAFAMATAYVEAELPKQLEPVLAELRRLQDEEWLREIGDVDPKDAN